MAVKRAKLIVSDEAVRKATGKGWKQWFALLDKAGARKMSHTEIATWLYEKAGCPGWWSQMVAVSYERKRGLRVENQGCDGSFQVNVSRTMAAPMKAMFDAWTDARRRARWAAKPDFNITKVNPGKNIRVKWVDGKSSMDVRFVAKPGGRTQITVDHSKLPDAKSVERMRKHWAADLDKMRSMVEA